MTEILRRAYVGVMRALRALLIPTGVMDQWARSPSPALRHLRSLFAIHDVHDLAQLDLPWWTYGAIRQVEEFLASRPSSRVFEYGSGASTAWLARRCATVTSVEHHAEFHGEVSKLLSALDNADLAHVPASPAADPTVSSSRSGHTGLDFADYVAQLGVGAVEYDLIVIDGRARLACLERAVEYLAVGGLIVFDDIGRRRYRRAVDTPGFSARIHRGARPCLPYPSTTGVLTHRAP